MYAHCLVSSFHSQLLSLACSFTTHIRSHHFPPLRYSTQYYIVQSSISMCSIRQSCFALRVYERRNACVFIYCCHNTQTHVADCMAAKQTAAQHTYTIIYNIYIFVHEYEYVQWQCLLATGGISVFTLSAFGGMWMRVYFVCDVCTVRV